MRERLPRGEGCAIYEATEHTPRHLEVYEFYVWETGIVNPPRKMFPQDFKLAAIIAKHIERAFRE